MTWFDTEDRARLLRLAAGFIEIGNYWFRYHVQKMGEDADDLARRLFDFAEELESGRLRPAPGRLHLNRWGCGMTKALEVIAAARRRDPVLELEAYCEAGGCPARVTTVRVKDYDDELLPLLRRRGGLCCPICGGPLRLHHAFTLGEAGERRRLEARGSVAVEMYVRDYRALAVPMGVYLDDRLPPTPPGWWDGMGRTTDEVIP